MKGLTSLWDTKRRLRCILVNLTSKIKYINNQNSKLNNDNTP
jgi:hypothetical protein